MITKFLLKYIKDNPIKEIKDIENRTLILPKSPSSKKGILDEYCSKENLELIPNEENCQKEYRLAENPFINVTTICWKNKNKM